MSIPFKISTFEQSTQPVQVEPTTPTEPTTSTEQIVAPTEPVNTVTEPSTTVVDDKGQLQNTTEPTAPVTTEQVQTPSDTVEFKMPSFEAPTTQTEAKEGVPQPQITSWKDAIKNVDRKELLKEAGLDDFDIEFSDYRKTGGDPYKYIAVKAIDYTKISDDVLAKEALRNEYPFLDDTKLDKLFVSRYKQDILATEDEKELGDIQKQADAYKYRQKMITEQQQFKMPQVQQQQAQPQDNAEQEKQIARRQQLIEYFNNNEATKSLNESKRVAINLGENVKPFNYNIDKPESLLSHALDGKKWARAIAINPQEPDETKLIPDVHKLQRLIINALNPNYEKDIFNYGMSYGLEKEIEKGMNAKKPDSKPSVPSKETLKEAFKTRVRVSTYGAPN